MIIGISGKINSGKDTVGKIIQFLTLDEKVFSKTNADIIADLEHKGYCASKSNWQIKKFADKLKDITCILLGCTREQLEDREFKEKELGKEWDKYIVEYDDFEFFGSKVFLTLEDANNALEGIREFYNNVSEPKLIKLTPRLLMQLLGTECGRNIIHPDIWCTALFVDYYKSIKELNPFGDSVTYFEKNAKHPNWIITDLRFSNELKAIEDKGGITIRVNRYCYDSAEDFLVCHPDKEVRQIGININNNENSACIDFEEPAKIHGYIPLREQHFSEKALDSAKFDYVIDNNSDINSLIEKVREILIKENIL